MSVPSPFRPLARFDDLVMHQLAQEMLVFDQRSHHIHQLDAVNAATWRLCDGERTAEDLARLVSRELGEPVTTQTIDLALTQLSEAGLLVTPKEATGPRESRRSLLRKAAIGGAFAVPTIVSVSAPQAAAAQSNCAGEMCNGVCCVGGQCDANGFCCPLGVLCNGVCCPGGTCDGNGNCCFAGLLCPTDGVCCVGGVCDGEGRCCTFGPVCPGDGQCCMGGFCDGNGRCCPIGYQICGADRTCCAFGQCVDGTCLA